MPDVPRLVVVGGSSADGYGVERHEAYATIVSEAMAMPIASTITPALRMSDAASMLSNLDLSPEDLLLLHVGLVDTTPRMPRRWYAIVKTSRRGRGSYEHTAFDRRVWSRLRRRVSAITERTLAGASGFLGLDRPVTSAEAYAQMCSQVERQLQTFNGLALVMVSERGPSVGTRLEPLAQAYAATFHDLVVRVRQQAGLPTGSVDLSTTLTATNYLDDDFHPNASGHRLIADACLRVLDEARTGIPAGH